VIRNILFNHVLNVRNLCVFLTFLFILLPQPPPQCHHMSLMDFVDSPPGCGRSLTDFWDWDAHQARLRCPDYVDGDIWIWSTGRGFKSKFYWTTQTMVTMESSPSRKNPHGRTGNRTRDLMNGSPNIWSLDREAGLHSRMKDNTFWPHWSVSTVLHYHLPRYWWEGKMFEPEKDREFEQPQLRVLTIGGVGIRQLWVL
jgi:hypothetical protein